jgi:hypothetical protein
MKLPTLAQVRALWLVLSYALWAHRRLAEGWALLRG